MLVLVSSDRPYETEPCHEPIPCSELPGHLHSVPPGQRSVLIRAPTPTLQPVEDEDENECETWYPLFTCYPQLPIGVTLLQFTLS